MIPILSIFVYLLVVGACVAGAWWVYTRYVRPKPSTLKPIPKFPDATKTALLDYFEKNPTASTDLDREWRDCLRLVPLEWKLVMLDRCTTNTTALARGKAMTCAFYRMARVWTADPAAYALENVLNLLTLTWAVRSDSADQKKRTDFLAYDSAKQEVRVKEPVFVREVKDRVQYIVNKGYAVPMDLQNALRRPDTEALVLSVDIFLYVMLETYVKFIPENKANCALCAT
jgi:hypothetical protein